MASLSPTWLYQDGFGRGKTSCSGLQTPFLGSFSTGMLQVQFCLNPPRKTSLLPCIKCEKKDEPQLDYVTVERYPYHSYMDRMSGQMEPASGARASIPTQEYWPEGTADRVRAARAPKPKGVSTGSPSFGKKPGSRRKKYKTSVSAPQSSEVSTEISTSEDADETTEEQGDVSGEYVVYETGTVTEESEYALDKKIGRPHPFIDPKIKKPIEGIRSREESWWNWQKPEKEQWSRWQRKKPDVETVFLKAMAETGQVKLYGDEPTLTEAALYRSRKHLFKEERLQAERERLERDGPMAYYSEWVKEWKQDTSREAIQKRFEETGEDENTQLIEMFCHQTDREFRIMMGTDIRIPRDPLVMRMREDLIKQIWGGDPVYPTINYIQDPNQIIDYRGADFHEPTSTMLDYLREHGQMITREELDNILAKEKTQQLEITDIDEAMSQAVDIGENDDEGDDSEEEEEVAEEAEEKIPRNWSVYKTTPQAPKPKKAQPKKEGPMSLEEAIDDSENLTDFLMDFDEEEA